MNKLKDVVPINKQYGEYKKDRRDCNLFGLFGVK